MKRIENVKALLSTSAGWFKDQILEKVANMGYAVEYGVLAVCDFGVPQARRRAIFICSRIGRVPLPIPVNPIHVTVREAISDLAYLASGEGMFEQAYSTVAESDYQRRMRLGNERLYNHHASNHAAIAIKKLMMIPPECGKEHLPETMKGRQKFSGTWGRLKWDSVSPTIDTRFDAASNGTNNHLVFIEAKKGQLTLHDLGQLWAYCKRCDPREAYLLSPGGLGSLNKVLNNLSRQDILEFGSGKLIKKMYVGKWDVKRSSIDYGTLVPKSM